jgi:hypothetical protein
MMDGMGWDDGIERSYYPKYLDMKRSKRVDDIMEENRDMLWMSFARYIQMFHIRCVHEQGRWFSTHFSNAVREVLHDNNAFKILFDHQLEYTPN